MQKKSLFVMGFFLLVLTSFIIPQAKAYSYTQIDFQTPMYEGLQMFQDFFGPIFEIVLGVGQFEPTFFAIVLLSILLSIMIYTILIRTELFIAKRGIAFIVAIIVSILGLRFLPHEYINGIMLPYGVLGIAIATIFPFIIYFFFVHYSISSGAGRRLAWIFFALVFFGLWYQRRADLGAMNWIYWIAIIGVLISVFADGKIHEYFGIAEARQARRERINLQITHLETMLAQFRTQNPTPSPTARRTMDRLEQQIQDLYRKI